MGCVVQAQVDETVRRPGAVVFESKAGIEKSGGFFERLGKLDRAPALNQQGGIADGFFVARRIDAFVIDGLVEATP